MLTLTPYKPTLTTLRKPEVLTLIDCYFIDVPVGELDNLHQLLTKRIEQTSSITVIIDMLQLAATVLTEYQTNTDQHMVVQAAWKRIKKEGSWRQKQHFNQFINYLNAGA